MSDIRDAAAAVLGRFAGKEGVLGIAIVARDGLPVVRSFDARCNQDAVCAMAAAMIGAADAALLDLGGEEATTFQATSGSMRFSGAGLDDDLLVLVVTRAGAADVLDEAVAQLRGVMKEA